VRCFVALDLPEPVCNHLANLGERLQRRFPVRMVDRHQLHLTLLFAGDVDDHVVDGLAAAVHAVALPPLRLHLRGFGHFPPRGVPRVLWAGLGGDDAAVVALHEELAARAAELGVPRDARDFAPHVTIGRVKSEFGALALVDALAALEVDLKTKPFAPTQLVLYASELRPSGPVHRPLVARPLPPAALA